jgi:PAS domain S-box-containing protein
MPIREPNKYEKILADPAVREAERVVLFDNALTGVAHVAPDGTFMKVNRQFANMLGYSPKELEGVKSCYDLTHPEDLPATQAEDDALKAGEQTTYSITKRFLHKYGPPVYCTVSVSRVETADREFVHFVRQAQPLPIPERNLTLARDGAGNAILQPVVPLSDFLIRNWKVVGSILLAGAGAGGGAINSYYDAKAEAKAMKEELRRVNDQLNKLPPAKPPAGP